MIISGIIMKVDNMENVDVMIGKPFNNKDGLQIGEIISAESIDGTIRAIIGLNEEGKKILSEGLFKHYFMDSEEKK